MRISESHFHARLVLAGVVAIAVLGQVSFALELEGVNASFEPWRSYSLKLL